MTQINPKHFENIYFFGANLLNYLMLSLHNDASIVLNVSHFMSNFKSTCTVQMNIHSSRRREARYLVEVPGTGGEV